MNNIAVAEWRSAMLEAFQKGRKKGYVVTHVGVSGKEGKSFLLKPLFGVFGPENVFISPAKGNFPLMGASPAGQCGGMHGRPSTPV